ncbi:unnamed protein product [Danaus chrysippus]|uniref:(African queen) hypothetical protein n=1 Tax=Danaus chrysippus TaxID=151541 RepID=A0A8J2W8E0_9NEOP|nr:unnamed protein product [Danaus chrysippus]
MERICCLQEQFDKDFSILPDPQRSNISIVSSVNSYDDRDFGLKLSFLRLYRLMHITMLLSLIYFCNICLWFIMFRKVPSRRILYKFKMSSAS